MAAGLSAWEAWETGTWQVNNLYLTLNFIKGNLARKHPPHEDLPHENSCVNGRQVYSFCGRTK